MAVKKTESLLEEGRQPQLRLSPWNLDLVKERIHIKVPEAAEIHWYVKSKQGK